MTVENRSGRAELGANAARCVVCDHVREGARCAHCGAAASAGHFTVAKQIAQTPRGRMYLAQDEQGRQVALKEIVFSAIPGLAQLESFRREARLLAELDHPAIPRFVDSFEEGTGVGLRLYLAQEFLEGESLLAELERRRFDEDEARRIAEQVLEILVWLQRRSPAVFHRDLKPANLIRRPDGSIGLVDFGSARDSVMGTLGATIDVGTFGYAPPEQLGGEVDATSDLYALGTTLLHLLTRKPPREALGGGSFARLSLTDSTRAFLERLVAPARTDRFASAAEALDALRTGVVRRETGHRERNLAPGLLAAGFAGAAFLAVMAFGVVAATFLGGGTVVSKVESPVSQETVVRKLTPRAWDSTQLGADPQLEKLIFRELIVAGSDGEELRQYVETDRRSRFAGDNLEAIRFAQEGYRSTHGQYLAFDEGTAEIWQKLGVTLVEPQHHKYSASVVGETLSMQAVGNLDEDATLDRWTSSTDVNDGSPLQTAMDVLNFDYVTMSVVADPPTGVAPFVRELAIVQQRAHTARTTLEAVAKAQGIYKQGHGAYLEFDQLTPEIAQKLGISLPSPLWHRYSATTEGGKLLLHAKGNVDPDPEPDEWRLEEGKPPSQIRMDWASLGERAPRGGTK